MVAVKAQQANAVLTRPDTSLTAFLIYGSDTGLVSERAVRLAQSLAARDTPPGEIVRIDDPELEDDSERLSVELLTLPMFGGRKIVRTTMGRRVNGALLRGILEGPTLAGVLIVEGGNLRADDTARQVFEKSPHAAAIPCFADDAQSLDLMINEMLGAHRLSITPDAREMLLARLGADRGLSRGEVEKLALYAAGRGTIEAEAVEAIVGDASELAMERVIDAAAAGDGTRAIEGCQRLLASGEGAQSIIAAVQWHFARLHRIRGAIEGGRSMDEAMRQIRPPLHFKRRAAVEAQCRRWTAPKLAAALARIRASALAARTASSLEDAHAERLLMELARLAAARDTSALRA
ncbi:MAG: DNA polymerase III subunit delta [Hyphomicrobium sp.]|nr:DNA polymerase III subunit delta [Hyphomicrobium sp.]